MFACPGANTIFSGNNWNTLYECGYVYKCRVVVVLLYLRAHPD